MRRSRSEATRPEQKRRQQTDGVDVVDEVEQEGIKQSELRPCTDRSAVNSRR